MHIAFGVELLVLQFNFDGDELELLMDVSRLTAVLIAHGIDGLCLRHLDFNK